MWQKAGVPWRWSEEQYAEKLKIGGGKERMRALFSEPAFQAVHRVPNDEAAQKNFWRSGTPGKLRSIKRSSRLGMFRAESG